MMETKVGLACLLSNYVFDVSKETKEPIEFDPKSFVLLTKGGVWLNYRKVGPETTEL